MIETKTPSSPLMGRHNRVTGLSGNEIYCLNKLNLKPGNLCIGNSVFSLGIVRGLTTGLKVIAGGEIPEISNLVHEGRSKAFARMKEEASKQDGIGIVSADSELVNHGGNIEFLSIGSLVHKKSAETEHVAFSTAASAQELYCQLDCGFQPRQFVFGNVAYSIGVSGNVGGFFKSMARGEVEAYSKIFEETRHIALKRITDEAKRNGANAVIGIETTITPFMGAQEMLMMGTASSHPALVKYADTPVTSDMTNEELWNMVNLGYLPLRLVMGVSVYSLGIAGGISAAFQSLARGEINTLTQLIYEAREKALDKIEKEAERWGADEVVGVKVHVYDLGSGLIEFLAIGTAVKKFEGITTGNQTLLNQAIIVDRETYFEGGNFELNLRDNVTASARRSQGGPVATLIGLLMFAMFIGMFLLSVFLGHPKH